MAHNISVQMVISDAQKVQELGRKLYKDDSLGINQAAFVLLNALASGSHKLVKVSKPKKVVEEPEEPESE